MPQEYFVTMVTKSRRALMLTSGLVATTARDKVGSLLLV